MSINEGFPKGHIDHIDMIDKHRQCQHQELRILPRGMLLEFVGCKIQAVQEVPLVGLSRLTADPPKTHGCV